jgi:hypothetical protein
LPKKGEFSLLRTITAPLFHRRLRRLERHAKAALADYHTALPDAFERLAQTSQTDRPSYHWKALDLVDLLEELRPRSVVELGSGRTTLVFAAYADRHGAAFVAFEQDPAWVGMVHQALTAVSDRRPVTHVPVEELPLGARFARELPPDADFVYVDAPFVPKARPFATRTGKPAYLDVPRLLESGHRPAAIVVDGRTDTVDEILKTAAGTYRFAGDYGWAIERGRVGHALRLARHSVFRRR